MVSIPKNMKIFLIVSYKIKYILFYMTGYSSLATANCEFTFEGIPPFTATFSASASDNEKKKAMKFSKKIVLQTVEKYIKERSNLIKTNITISYKVKRINEGNNNNNNNIQEKKNIEKNPSSCGCGKK